MSFTQSPSVRMWVRTLVVAVITFFIASLSQGKIDDWSNFLWGLVGAVAYAILGLLTPVEPLVGVKKEVEVPVPPAIPDRTP